MSGLPLVDLAYYRAGAVAETSAQVDAACQEFGFLLVSGHGVNPELVADMHAVSSEFFNQSEEYKLGFRLPGSSRGYVPFGVESLAATSGTGTEPDRKQAFAVGSVELAGEPGEAVAWPDRPTEFASVWRRYHQALRGLSETVLGLFTNALGVTAAAFTDRMNRGACFLRAIDYPAPDADRSDDGLRAGVHTDFGALTVLSYDAPGLQVCTPAGVWLDVPVVPGTFVVNIGDVMAVWSGHQWRSTPHRVVPGDVRRQAVVFFHNPNLDATVEPIRTRAKIEPAPLFGDWLRDKSRSQRAAM